jgi:hypothetical protein
MKTIEEQIESNCKYYNDYEKSAYELSFKAGVEFSQQWIDCNDDLPENDIEVLVKNRSNGYTVGMYSDGKWTFDFENFIGVTHWRKIELT